MKRCLVFELNDKRYALLGRIWPTFDRPQTLDVVEIKDGDWTTPPHEIPTEAEISWGDEGPFVLVRTVDGHPRQTRPGAIVVTVTVDA